MRRPELEGGRLLNTRSPSADKISDVIERLRAEDVRAVALTVVDNAGITRVKTVPVELLEKAVTSGVGLSPVFDVFLVNDEITTSSEVGGPEGDLRMVPDPAMVTPLAAQPGWAWAPADKLTQELEPFKSCQRSFARRMVDAATKAGYELKMSFETEWVLGRSQDDEIIPVAEGPAYGMNVLIVVSDYARDVLDALTREGVVVEQFHPEYALGQLEVSVAARDPLAAADVSVLVRQTIRGVALRHGLQVSFAPAVVAGLVGNGCHVHFSLWRGGRNQFAGGSGPYGMSDTGEAFLAGVLDALPALTAIGSPSVASYVRLVPSHWAGVYACWGRENREAAVRFVTGTTGTTSTAANAEVKSFDGSANPYLVVGCLIAAGLDGIERGLRLPPEVHGDPAFKQDDELAELGVTRLPQDLEEALIYVDRTDFLREAMGKALFDAFIATRRGEIELFSDSSPEEIVAATRWRY
jgi:glutamine synthetase